MITNGSNIAHLSSQGSELAPTGNNNIEAIGATLASSSNKDISQDDVAPAGVTRTYPGGQDKVFAIVRRVLHDVFVKENKFPPLQERCHFVSATKRRGFDRGWCHVTRESREQTGGRHTQGSNQCAVTCPSSASAPVARFVLVKYTLKTSKISQKTINVQRIWFSLTK